MSTRVLRVRKSASSFEGGLQAIQAEQQLEPEFPADVEAEASGSAAAPRLPDLDRTDIPFVTIDPPGAMDLDQAMHLERASSGYVVHYAIADVGAFVVPGGAVDAEARRRGESLYGADSKVPLHPTVISEGAASLLPDQVRPAFHWTIELDADGDTTGARVERALVRSTARLDYEGAQRQLDAATAPEVLQLLREVGMLRQSREAARGGVNLPMPEQEVACAEDGCTVEFRELHPVEEWNAQISLLTGFAAAAIMTDGKVGILRTLPPADPRAVKRLRRTARALDISWPDSQAYPDFVRSLDPAEPAHLAMVTACTSLLRGAGYTDFNGMVPEQTVHAALASEYAHVTAPLRRLVDRFGLEICASLCAGTPVPDWVLAALPTLPDTMRDSGRRARTYENAVLDLIEATMLHSRIGQSFPGVVIETERDAPTRGEVVVRDPAVTARVSSSAPLPVGELVTVTLVEADPSTRTVAFAAE